MFDDQPNNQNPGGQLPPMPNLPLRPVPIPPPVPTGPDLTPLGSSSGQEPPMPMAPPMRSAEPEDILADVDVSEAVIKGPVQPIVRPAVPVAPFPFAGQPASSPKPVVMPPARPLSPPAAYPTPGKNKMIKIVVLVVIILVVVAGLAAAGWYGYNLISKPVAPAAAVNQRVNTNQPAPVVPQVTAPAEVPAAVTPPPETAPLVNVAPPAAPLDSDRDGLTDAEEVLYGTDLYKADTDTDGLTDRDEIKIYHTDPLNPDTDGDGYLDGEEVINGYDPNGPGKLLKINQ